MAADQEELSVIAVGYTRVSTREQAEEGVSLAAQRRRIEAYCDAKGWELREIIEDAGHSGGKLDRPGLQSIIEACRRRAIGVVVVLRLDRLTRSVKDLGFLVEDVFGRCGVEFATIEDNFDTTTANGRLVMNVLASVVQWEREAISERTRLALAEKRRQGKFVGELPFGFDLAPDGESLLPNADEQRVLRRIRAARTRGQSFQAIADRLNRQGVPTKQGAAWYSTTVHRAAARAAESA
jgi:site-specific DNA recombinase